MKIFYKIKNYIVRLDNIDFIEMQTATAFEMRSVPIGKKTEVNILFCTFQSGKRVEILLDGLTEKEIKNIINDLTSLEANTERIILGDDK